MTAPTHDDYLHAAVTLWGPAGEYVYCTFDELNARHFDGELPALPIVIGITAFGRCLGLTRHDDRRPAGLPRITLGSNIFAPTEHSLAQGTQIRHGHGEVRDVLLHEMIHARLMLEGKDPTHNGQSWCDEIERLSPAVLRRKVKASPVKPRRLDGKVVRRELDGYLSRQEIATWPGSLRPASWSPGRPIPVDTY
jgi:hypothetical protein